MPNLVNTIAQFVGLAGNAFFPRFGARASSFPEEPERTESESQTAAVDEAPLPSEPLGRRCHAAARLPPPDCRQVAVELL